MGVLAAVFWRRAFIPGLSLYAFALLAALVLLGCPTHHPAPPDDGGQDAPTSDDGSPRDATTDAIDEGSLPEAGDGAAGTVVVGPDGASVQLPAGAFDGGTTLAITVATTSYPPLPASVVPVSRVYAFAPEGQSFASPVVVTIPFTAPPDAGSPVALYTAESGGAWTQVPGAQVAGNVIRASVDHFSYFFAGAPSAFLPVSSVALGGSFVCARMADQTVRCWGYTIPWHGSVPIDTCGVSALPCSKVPLQVPGLANVTAIAAGNDAVYAILSDGTFMSWGDNTYGQLGDGTTMSHFTPVAVSSLQGAVSVTAGDFHACVRFSNGSVKCWGRNDYGQVGDGTLQTTRDTPVTALATNTTAIAAQDFATCALGNGGTVSCWGYDERGQLGNGGTTSTGTPASVTLGASALTIAGSGKTAPYGFACAVLTDGTGRCWGENTLGQTGKGSTSTLESSPVVVSGLSGALNLAVGGAHACAALVDQTVACWGANAAGQLGDGTTNTRLSAVPVPGLQAVTAIAAADAETCAIASNGQLFCWGDNGYGQVGDGTISSRSAPSAVVW
jgi:alpha-tubulin suppressor-like RCC1 family protein